MEFGTRWGRHLALLTALRALHEPYNVHRRVIGFDTFSGFPEVGDIDRVGRHAHPGGLDVTAGYQGHLEEVLAVHESVEPLGHVRRTLCLAGDVRNTLPRYLEDNPQTLIGLAYFDLDLHGPTRDALTALIPYLSDGSILAFDQVGHPEWPGETVALREALGPRASHLALIPGFPSPVFMRWRVG
jgi:3-O-methyltransferase